MTCRVLIIDDEPLARRGIAALLAEHEDMHIVGECSNGYEALARILECAPDLIFLDIQMPGMTGFDVLNLVPKEKMPLTIFLTAYDQFALRAFDIHALDYLLKPIDEDRFVDALRHARNALAFRSEDFFEQRLRALLAQSDNSNEPIRYADRFSIRTGSRLVFVAAQEIDWIEAMGDYAGLHTPQKTHLLRESLNELALRLDPKFFVRVHRSAIVRIDRIDEMEALANRDATLRLKNGARLRVSRTYSEKLRELLR